MWAIHVSEYLRHSCHSADQNDIRDLTFADISILDGLLARSDSSLHQFRDQALKLGASKLHIHVLGTWSIHCQEWKIDVSLVRDFNMITLHIHDIVQVQTHWDDDKCYLHWRGQLNLCFLCGLSNPLNSHCVWRDVNSLLDTTCREKTHTHRGGSEYKVTTKEREK